MRLEQLFLKRRHLTLLALATFAFVVIHVAVTGQLPLLRRENIWSIAICDTVSPFDVVPASPVLTADDVTDVPALFVADPFMIQHNSNWYVFFEVLNRRSGHGDIGVAMRGADHVWRYQQIVLDEPFHVSYPNVFPWEGRIYMVPESEAVGEVRLYEAIEFPCRWQLVGTIVRRPGLADPTVFRWRDSWWMFAGRSHTHDELSLFFADDLLGPWREHPASPLMQANSVGARPGGRVVIVDGRLYRFGQDCQTRYGNKLHAYEITQLSRTDYAERPLATNPLLWPRTTDWNNCGMHHLDLQRVQDRWIAAVDGHTKKWIFRGPTF